MSEIVISADSTCDLSKELIDRFDIKITPLYIVFGSESKKDGLETNPEEIYEYVEKKSELTKTSAIPVGEYVEYFRQFTSGGKTVVHFDISSDFSSTCNNARIAAEEVGNVYVVDSRSLSTGIAHLVLEAKKMADEGLSGVEIKEKLEAHVNYVDTSFVICNLDYLKMGGRCSTVAAIGANILKLKPCIEVIDGKMTVGKKHRGTFAVCLAEYIKERLEANKENIITDRVFITHTKCEPEIIEMVKGEIEKYVHFDEICETDAGGTIACHCGPECLGIIYKLKVPKKIK